MKIKLYIARVIVAAGIVSLFAMCTKQVSIPEKTALPASKRLALSPDGEDIGGADTYTVQPNQWMVDGANMAPGTIIYIPAGTRGALLLRNLQGTAQNPIIVVNQGGRVTFTTGVTASYGFKTQNCSNFKVMGNGDPDVKYGFEVVGGNIGMTMDDLSSDFEIAYVEVHDSGFAGIMAKTDPTCDEATWRGNFTMRNVLIHHNYVHNTGGEGLYIGNSFYADGRQVACGTVFPHDIVRLKVYWNRVDSTGCEGIQVGSAISGAYIYNNTVRYSGLSPFASGQNNGIQLGEGTGGKCYNNMIKNAPGNGIIVLGYGDNQVYNNFIINAGEHGIFADSRFTPGLNFQFINNTIIYPGRDGIKMNSELIPLNTVINNAIIIRGPGIAINRKSSLVKILNLNNFVANDIAACQFVDAQSANYRLQATSPLVDAGLNVLLYGINADFYGKARPAGSGFDIGATEY
ncbi:right-handed parallel beta-helix repeat-containing protein [Mucilaginibacter pedocola]|uniref:Right handed beta helix domain-containing protein n=1 Tax=Mucilaginibacter pedocola TaxID=1792845 RepID=A0A1S9PFH0_9SPHI|nr:right-handed parallel beta-helix repeat-containing protein [Mucilaginibacter pedocola]OOQ59691.1 hypothetical protein BC343_05870 [Mucilaginibacter pedocola]